MKLSVVIICWNDLNYVLDCLRSIYAETNSISLEVIVADNGSVDGSVANIRVQFPQVRIIENRVNLGFGKGNNAGIRSAQGEYVLILNPDTIIRDRALEKLVSYADRHPEAGAFGCRVLNSDGSLQLTAHPMPTVWRLLMGALFLRGVGRISSVFISDAYIGWDGRTERAVGFNAACCLLVRGELIKQLGGFDPRFFHQFEDADLCRRIWDSGKPVLFCPEAEITHIGGQNRGGYPIEVVLETERSKYRYFHKHHGIKGLIRLRQISLIAVGLRYAGYRVLRLITRDPGLDNKICNFRVVLKWQWQLDPVRFIQAGEEPNVGYQPLSSASSFLEQPVNRRGKNARMGEPLKPLDAADNFGKVWKR
ncbi:MAG: hypothetical protein QOH39_2169 [Verrucomicrobiota bacterium]|jgi:GT2 family glycosyltransferase